MHRTAIVAVGGAVCLGLASRLPFLVQTDFPLNDGGLFYQMSREVSDAQYTLPAYTTYNADGIPFAYPPLGFFIAAFTTDVFHTPMWETLRVLPAMVSVLSIVVFFFLARSVLVVPTHSFLATAFFALAPGGFYWHIMGGGLTRSLGLLFGLTALTRARAFYEYPKLWRTIWCAAFASLAAISHLEMGLFTVFSFALFFLFYGRNRTGFIRLVTFNAVVLLMTSPWWLSVLSIHGVTPFRSASQSSEWNLLRSNISMLLKFDFTDEPLLTLLGATGVIGLLISILRGQWLLPAWLVAAFVMTPRSAASLAVVPLSMLGALGLCDVVAPGIQAAMHPGRWQKIEAGAEMLRPSQAVLIALYALPLGYLLMANWYRAYTGDHALHALALGDREAMGWVAQNTPTESVFLVLSPSTDWGEDYVAEWFPALAMRKSILTPQGTEWVDSRTFERRKHLHRELHDGSLHSLAALEEWCNREGLVFSHVYISRAFNIPKTGNRGRAINVEGMRQQFLESPSYFPLHNTPGATVLMRSPFY